MAELNQRIKYRAEGLQNRADVPTRMRETFMYVNANQFRPNLVVGGPGIAAFSEDTWQEVSIGSARFAVAGELLA